MTKKELINILQFALSIQSERNRHIILDYIKNITGKEFDMSCPKDKN